MALQDPPATEDLLVAVREYLQEEILPNADQAKRVHALMAIKIMGVIERELSIGPRLESEHEEALRSLGISNEAELAAAIRSGSLDSRRDELVKVLRHTTASKLMVASPAFLDRAQKEAAAIAARQAKRADAAANG